MSWMNDEDKAHADMVYEERKSSKKAKMSKIGFNFFFMRNAIFCCPQAGDERQFLFKQG